MTANSTTPFYVIERHIHSELNYWHPDGFTTDINRAVKFWDTDGANYILTRLCQGIGNVVQHLYMDALTQPQQDARP